MLHQSRTLPTRNSKFYVSKEKFSTATDPCKCIAVGTNNPANGDVIYFIAQDESIYLGLVYIIKVDFLND